MRIFIISLSIVFFLLSGLITYRALEIPGYDFSYKESPKTPMTKREPAKDISPEEEQDKSRADLDEPKATVTEADEKMDKNNPQGAASETQASDRHRNEEIVMVLGGGTFQPGKVVISKNYMSAVNELVQTVAVLPDHDIVIEGHTDNIPITASAGMHYQDNMDLSFLRANAIARVLVQNGISRERISVKGYGETRPVASNDTVEGRAKNRRVEVKLIPGSKDK